MSYYVYILESEKTGKYYIGQSSNINDRLTRHNKGYEKSTRYGRPWKLIYKLKYDRRDEAIIIERKLKKFKSRKRLIKWVEKERFGGRESRKTPNF